MRRITNALADTEGKRLTSGISASAGNHEMIPPDVSHMLVLGLPESESQSGFYVNKHLIAMDSLLENFQHALALVDRCEQELDEIRTERNGRREKVSFGPEWMQIMEDASKATRLRFSWIQMSARVCAMTIWDFRWAMVSAKINLERTSVLKSKVSMPQIESALAMFKDLFGDAEEIRAGAAHPVDFHSTPGSSKLHSIKGPLKLPGLLEASASVGTLSLMSNIAGRTVYYSINQKERHFDLTQESLAKLQSLRDRFISAFFPASTDAFL